MYTSDKASGAAAMPANIGNGVKHARLVKRRKPHSTELPDAPPCAKKIRETWFRQNDEA
jgi:hypothetical protein